jgi:O-antigen/teichoic acid export membrane protein
MIKKNNRKEELIKGLSIFPTQLFKSSSIYLLGGLASSGISFLLLPILTRYLTPFDYGILAVINSLSGFLLSIVLFCQNSSYQRFYYDFDSIKSKSLLFNSVIVITISGFFTGIFILILQMIVNFNFGFENRWLLIILFMAYSNAIRLLIQGYFQISKRPTAFTIISISNVMFIMLVTIYFVVYNDYDWQGRVWATFISSILFLPLCFGFIFFSGKFSFNPSKDILRDIIFFGGGLLPGALSGLGLNLADRFILSYMAGAETTGLYNVGYQFGFIVYLFVAASGRAWSPYFWENYLKKGKKGKKNIYKASRIILIGIFFLALFVSLAGPVVLRFMVSPTFYGASQYIVWIAFGYAIQGFQIVFSPYLSYYKKTLLMSAIAIASVAVNIILNILLIPTYGGQGAAIATFFSFLFSLLIEMFYVYKLEGISIMTILKN